MLGEYKRKRDFRITPEPSGQTSKGKRKSAQGGAKSLSFVIQKHAARRLHYDFRLEIDGVMVSWAVPKGPSLNPRDKRLAVMTEDHPMEYADFEGIIPEKQYGAGEVIIWDKGTYSPDEKEAYSWQDKEQANRRMREGLKKGKLSFYLKGEKLEGSWALVKLHDKEKDWLLIKHHDQFEDAQTDITELDASVASGRTLEDMQENGADRIWTRKGEESADPLTTGRSSKASRFVSTLIRGGPAKESTNAVGSRGSRGSRGSNGPEDPENPEASRAPKNSGASRNSEASRSNTQSPSKRKAAADSARLNELLKGAKKGAFPKEIVPLLATLADEPFDLPGWTFEPKLDGIRAIAYIKNGSCRLASRRGLDLTGKYPAVCRSLAKVVENQLVLDGEIVALDENGVPSFQYLQQSGGGLRSFAARSNRQFASQLVYYVFDILHAQGKDLMPLPLVVRKEILALLLRPDETVRLVSAMGSDGPVVFRACLENGLEGMVGKREDSIYEPGTRSRSWLKVKNATSAEFLICGFTEGTGSRRNTFGSLILGEHDDTGKLHYVGGVGTGFNSKSLSAILYKMKPLVQKTCPFDRKPPGKLNPTWTKPELVAEVKFMERTQDNILRAPVFMHLREDIEPQAVKEVKVIHMKESAQQMNDITQIPSARQQHAQTPKKASKGALSEPVQSVLAQLENDKKQLTLEIDGDTLPVTNLDKVFWPAFADQTAITKRHYLQYLAQISDWLIPHLMDRLITLVRFPNGIHGGRFYQKHWEKGLPKFVKTASVYTEHENKDQDFLVCNNLATLLWLGQLADLEIHTSHTRISATPDAPDIPEDMTGSVKQLENSVGNYPDFMVLDLDPYLYSGQEKSGAEPELHRKGFENCAEVALYLKQYLDEMRLKAFLKTSGKTGLHIYVPIKRNIDYDTVRHMSELICQQILRDHPSEVTMDWAVKKRVGKVFMDHNMNARSKSLASLYSPRVAAEASVSTPIAWEELSNIYPTDFTIHTLPSRLHKKGDLWSDILNHKNDLQSIFGSRGSPLLLKRNEDKKKARTQTTRRRENG